MASGKMKKSMMLAKNSSFEDRVRVCMTSMAVQKVDSLNTKEAQFARMILAGNLNWTTVTLAVTTTQGVQDALGAIPEASLDGSDLDPGKAPGNPKVVPDDLGISDDILHEAVTGPEDDPSGSLFLKLALAFA